MGSSSSTQRPSMIREYRMQNYFKAPHHGATSSRSSGKHVAALSVKHCSPKTTMLHVREKTFSLSGDDFTIRDARSGETKFRVKGSTISVSDRKTLVDAHNQTVAVMQKELSSSMSTFRIAGMGTVFTVKAKLAASTVLDCQFRDVATGKLCRLSVNGDWRAKSVIIYAENKGPIARVYRPARTSRNVVLGKQDYYVEIAPNVDSAMISLVCIAIDESRRV